MKSILMKMSILLASVLILSCSKDDDGNAAPSGQSLGTFEGNFQVSDDPQTNLGYVYNSKITVTRNGSNATITIIGNDGFNREYTGTSTSSVATFAITKQTKPVEKTAGGSLVIVDNELAFDLDLANDAVVVRATPTSTTSFTISGKIQMVGTNLLKI